MQRLQLGFASSHFSFRFLRRESQLYMRLGSLRGSAVLYETHLQVKQPVLTLGVLALFLLGSCCSTKIGMLRSWSVGEECRRILCFLPTSILVRLRSNLSGPLGNSVNPDYLVVGINKIHP
jgi:hypothetical protein